MDQKKRKLDDDGNSDLDNDNALLEVCFYLLTHISNLSLAIQEGSDLEADEGV